MNKQVRNHNRLKTPLSCSNKANNEAPPTTTTGSSIRAPSKPSELTGKSGRDHRWSTCHLRPSKSSKDKTKGSSSSSSKLRSLDHDNEIRDYTRLESYGAYEYED